MRRALEIVRVHGGQYDEQALKTAGAQRQGAAGQWRDSFLRMPYFREVLTPRGIIESLDLRRPIYRKTASYGHFGRNEPEFSWEKTDLVDQLKAAI